MRLVGLVSIAVLDGEAWVAIGCCRDGCAFDEVEVADACRSAAREGRALTFTTPPLIVQEHKRTTYINTAMNARAGTCNKCRHHML